MLLSGGVMLSLAIARGFGVDCGSSGVLIGVLFVSVGFVVSGESWNVWSEEATAGEPVALEEGGTGGEVEVL